MQHQQGFSMLRSMLLVFVIVLFSVTIIRVTPAYIKYFTVRSAIQQTERILQEQTQRVSGNRAIAMIRRRLTRQFSTDGINDLDGDKIAIERTGHDYAISIKYEVRVPLFANIDMLVSFDNTGLVKQKDV